MRETPGSSAGSPAGGVSTRRNEMGREVPSAATVAYACASCSGVIDRP